MGYASSDYHLTDYKPADLVKMQILVNGEPVDALFINCKRVSFWRSRRYEDAAVQQGRHPAGSLHSRAEGG
jgi:translation elongation factor EF-4